jgi:hypothetical protein
LQKFQYAVGMEAVMEPSGSAGTLQCVGNGRIRRKAWSE